MASRTTILSYVLVFFVTKKVSTSNFTFKQPHLIKTGFTNILWEYIESNSFQSVDNVSSLCKLSLNHATQSLPQGKLWSIQLIESSGSIPEDLSGAGYVSLGDFDSCQSLKWTNHDGNDEFGSYCLASFLPAKSQNLTENIFTKNKIISAKYGVSIKVGFCLPSSCSPNDLRTIASNALKPYDWDLYNVDHCLVTETFSTQLSKSSVVQKMAFLTFIALISTVLIANIMEYTSVQNNNDPDQATWTRHFSFSSNYKQISEPKSTKVTVIQQYSIILHSIVIVIHATMWSIILQVAPIIATLVMSSKLYKNRQSPFLSLFNSDWVLEGIFVYGGFTHSMTLWKQIGPKTTLISALITTFKKLISLSLMIAITAIIQISLPLLGSSGPYNLLNRQSSNCIARFWDLISLSSHQIDDPTQTCLEHFWSVSVESRSLFVLVTLVFLYKRAPKVAIISNLMVIFGSLSYLGYLHYVYRYQPFMYILGVEDVQVIMDYSLHVYLQPATHIWMYSSCSLATYLIMNNYHSMILKLPIISYLNVNRYWYGGVLAMFQPFYVNFIRPFGSRTADAISPVTFRALSLGYWLIILLRMGPEARKMVLDSTNPNENSTSEKSTVSSAKDEIPYKKAQFYSIVSYILRSTYCFHVTILTIALNLIRSPVKSTTEMIFFCLFQIIACIFGGVWYHFFVLGPLTSLFNVLRNRNKFKSQ